MKLLFTYLSFLFTFAYYGQEFDPTFCDSISITNQTATGFDLETTFESDVMFFFYYSGFVLENQVGDTVATETLETAGNVYGFGSLYSDSRKLIATGDGVSNSFEGTLRLVDGWFVSDTTSLCTFPYEVPAVTLSIESKVYSNRVLVRITDLKGEETSEQPQKVLFYHYDDGTVEKVFIIK